MKTLTTLEELDAKLKECLATATTQTDLQRHFASFQMASKISQKDPFSSQYQAEQMELYRWIAGKTYDISNEVVEFDVEPAIRCPFPYASEDLQVVGNQFIAIGSLLRRLNVPRRGRILEFGPGWGNTTLAMALSGYQVTAVDIEKRFCELIR